jgi:hypothetical protein
MSATEDMSAGPGGLEGEINRQTDSSEFTIVGKAGKIVHEVGYFTCGQDKSSTTYPYNRRTYTEMYNAKAELQYIYETPSESPVEQNIQSGSTWSDNSVHSSPPARSEVDGLIVHTVTSVAQESLDQQIQNIDDQKTDMDQLDSNMKNVLNEKMENQLNEKISDFLNDKMADQLNDKMNNQLNNDMADQLKGKMSDQLNVKMADGLHNNMTSQLSHQLSVDMKYKLPMFTPPLTDYSESVKKWNSNLFKFYSIASC